MKLFWGIIIFLLGGCAIKAPEGITPVSGFDQERYLGMWYEIARLDHSFERGLSNVSATYTLRDDGGIRVINKGFDTQKQAWRTAEGKAFFVKAKDVGFLKVSFFGPFYGAYVIFELDHAGYSYAFVAGDSRDYLWLLSRTPHVPEKLLTHFKETAKGLGFDTQKLIFTKQQSKK